LLWRLERLSRWIIYFGAFLCVIPLIKSQKKRPLEFETHFLTSKSCDREKKTEANIKIRGFLLQVQFDLNVYIKIYFSLEQNTQK